VTDKPTESGPRAPDHQELTGTGTPRSADTGEQAEGAMGDRNPPVDPAVAVGATTSSHPAEVDDAQVNRSGSGGSGGPSTEDDPAVEGSTPASMNELLSGRPDGG
jgi:hypothetical protein